MQRCGITIKANIMANGRASMSKKEITKWCVREQETKEKRQYADLYGPDVV
jgi:elongation factor P hydroxylase